MLGHTLLAGITGSGKSYAEHMMIETLIEQRAILYLVDPKRVELGKYKGKGDGKERDHTLY